MRVSLAALLTIIASDAAAHEAGVGPESSWSFFVAAPPLALAALAYGVGMSRLWAASGLGRTVHLRRAACFAAGWLSLAFALLSPLERIAAELFTAHMIEHEILMVVAAPLLVLSRPLVPVLWSLPRRARLAAGKALRSRALLAPLRKATGPLSATALHATALWLWHAPGLYEVALINQSVHWLQHFSFLSTALLFWWAMLFGRGRETHGVSIFYLFATTLHSGFLGILLSLARTPLYPTQGFAAAEWGLSPLEDQQLAGLIMWVPGGMIYLAAALTLAALWIGDSSASRDGENHHGLTAR